MTQLESWPDLVSGPPRCAVGRSYGTPGAPGEARYELVHFHSDDAADVCLTRAAVDRLRPQLAHNSAIRVRPGASWVTVLLDGDMDIALLLTLVSVGLKAHDDALALRGAQGPPGRAAPPCDWEARVQEAPLAPVPTPPTPAPATAGPAGLRGLRATWKAVGRLMPHGH
nr:luciferase family protein [Streptomyces longispororuber]